MAGWVRMRAPYRIALVADAGVPGAFQVADDRAALNVGDAAGIAVDDGIAVDAQRYGKARCAIVMALEIAADPDGARSKQLARRSSAMLNLDIAFDGD
jgi:hypothetical protein